MCQDDAGGIFTFRGGDAMIFDSACITKSVLEDEQNMVPIRYLKLNGKCKEIRACYGDIIIIINAMADYADLLDEYRRMFPEKLDAFQTATYEYQAGRCRKIQKSLEKQMEYDREKAIEKCKKYHRKQEDNDIGEEALALLARRKASEEKKKEETEKPAEPVKKKTKSKDLDGQLSFL